MTDALQSEFQALATRTDNLEMKVTYQDEVIEELNKAIVEQWRKLDQAVRMIERLEKRLREAQEQAGPDGRNEPPPPHY